MKQILALIPCLLTFLGCSMNEPASDDIAAHDPWVIRTFSDRPELWNSLKTEISAPVGALRFRANVRFVDDPKFYGLSPMELVHSLPPDYPGGFVFIADGETTSAGEDTIELVYFYPDSLNPADYERHPSSVPASEIQIVRHLPHVVQELENNLTIANIDMTDVNAGVPPDGIYRGIEE